uniref:Phospholipid-transporting ATPase n=1 Tax=Acrobeloides nanus TaxID=290746 RepID=A0A914CRH5_9BILA
MLSVCHTVVPEKEDNVISYQASSPDEGALVRGAATIGFEFHTRKPDRVTIRAMDRDIEYEILNILEFTSDRKRMGVVVREEDGKIKLYVKGADNIIFDRLSKEYNKEMRKNCYEQLEEYATKGYRTLCFAMAEIDPEVYQDWARRFHEASISIDRREQKLAEIAEEIENNLLLVGATAIEDKLQEGVPETIKALMKAGIRIWMLTGDKRETAINIAQSSALTTQSTSLLILDKKSYDETFLKLESFVETSRQFIRDKVEFALVINGHALHHAFIGEARRLFAELCMNCRAVICCRMTPIQKAEIVDMVKSIDDHIVLSIGDGANDVAMIQAASVGVGITGEEGLRAASASDYSIAQFRFLQKLLLVHGTWNLDRTVKVILYSFYKNITLYIIELWFALFSAFSGQTIFERWTIALFNVIFSSWPPVILGLFDRPLPEEILLKHTFLYEEFQKNSFSLYMFALWLFVSLWHSLLLFFLTYLFMAHEVVWSNGRVGGWLMLGNACYTYTVATVCLKSLLECDSWNFVQVFFSIGSIISWFVFLIFYSMLWPFLPFASDMCGMATIMMSSGTFWMGFIFVPTITLLFDFIVKGTINVCVHVARSTY